MKTNGLLSLLCAVFFTFNLKATTWDEPWVDKVYKDADYFILANVDSCHEKKGIYLTLIKQFAGEKLPQKIHISNFYLLDLTSLSGGHGPEFRFSAVKESYFFIKKNKRGEFCIATPTTGFDYVTGDDVITSFRHSYHRCKLSRKDYELLSNAIYNYYHGIQFDLKPVTLFIDENLSLKPAGFSENDIAVFFKQHVAMEAIFHLKINGYYDKLMPFYNDTTNFHHQVSAARALSTVNTIACKRELIKYINNKNAGIFLQVICIWSLKGLKPTELKKELNDLVKFASEEENGFGGDIMDPRVGTHFPDVKSALVDLISSL